MLCCRPSKGLASKRLLTNSETSSPASLTPKRELTTAYAWSGSSSGSYDAAPGNMAPVGRRRLERVQSVRKYQDCRSNRATSYSPESEEVHGGPPLGIADPFG